ncbi:MAG: hypothetical protein A2Y03_00525 [Omnitrophica WOR_2 bacterium GWF2_38_59]|nr:MAG: hypothetical protein A2Y03_00525 [Omnitrophica WOR_2 bacterium GWF2_38_59]OGX49547.1 MAG: hypothetical protein A2243_10680 [Omnitrophica WOR_2 bacterium RIFOXYA2_FULL_38_17]OGX58743.1 MAG: hypothetical protein A2306_12305 [Omnitrophica WOR_2 bacterium RIFOXYB2_FULL_38_16]HBG62157.1 nuclease [Candidatus Omnitrophota bacterium]
MKQKKKSPIKGRSLRHAGQSLDERLDDLINEKAFAYIIAIFVFILFASYEWLQYFNIKLELMTFVAVPAILFCMYKLKEISKEARAIKLGRDGERDVGQYLENLRESGYRVFHDIIGDNFNLDHVIISTKGLYVIETKTYRKPLKGDSRITFDGKKLIIPGCKEQSGPIVQVNAAASWLKNRIQESTGKSFSVKPVILFPGWYVESTEKAKQSNVWVLSPKAFPTYIDNQPEVMTKEDMMLVVFHISRYICAKF